MKIINLAPRTTEVGYLNLSALSTRLPSLEILEIDLRRESMWAYSRVPSMTQEDILTRELDWRLGTIFGVDAATLRQDRMWKLVVYAEFMLPADPDGNSATRAQRNMVRLNIVSTNLLLKTSADSCRSMSLTKSVGGSSLAGSHAQYFQGLAS